MSVSSTANLIKPIETDSSGSSSTAGSSYCYPAKPVAVDEDILENYKNDLYRSSHQIIYKQQLFQQQQGASSLKAKLPMPPSTSIVGEEIAKPNLGLLYEARPLNVGMWASSNSAMSGSLAAVERDQMIDRLSAAIANLNNSMCNNNLKTNEQENEKINDSNEQKNLGDVRQISCV